jgi:hypothetical protein
MKNRSGDARDLGAPADDLDVAALDGHDSTLVVSGWDPGDAYDASLDEPTVNSAGDDLPALTDEEIHALWPEAYRDPETGLWVLIGEPPPDEPPPDDDETERERESAQHDAGASSLIREGDIAAVLRGDVEPTKLTIGWRDDGDALYAPGLVHDLHGESSLGKTWLAQHVLVEMLASGGAALWIDYESTLPRFVERLLALGAEPELLARRDRLRYVQSDGAVRDPEREHLARIIASLDPHPAAGVLIGIDAAGAALARDGRDENNARDVGEWYERTVRPLAATGGAVVVIDQVARDPATRTRGSRGSGQKLYLVDVSYAARSIGRPFSKTRPGGLKLVCAKDRTGSYAVGETVANAEVTPHDGGRVAVRIDSPGPERPTVLMDRIVEYLASRSRPASMTGIERDVKGKAQGLRWARDCLLDDGTVRYDDDGRLLLATEEQE